MTETIVRLRWWLAAALLLVTGGLAVGAGPASVPDNALTVWFLESDPQLERYRSFHREFGNDEVVLIQLERPAGIFERAGLTQIQQATRAIEAIDGVRYVHSVCSVQDAISEGSGVRFDALIDDPLPADDAALKRALDRAVSHPLVRDRLVSADGKRAMLWVELEVLDDIDARRDAIVGAIRTTADEVFGEAPHPMAGMGVIFSGLNQVVQHDFGLFVTVGYLLMFGMLGWAFRSVRLVVATLGVVTVAILCALGAYGLAGHRLNMVTVLLPTVVLVLGVADAVHFPSAYADLAQERPELGRLERVAALFGRLWAPCALTSLTTVVSFLALATSPMAALREFGVYSALGIAVAFLASFVFMGIALTSTRVHARPPRSEAIDRRLGWLAGVVGRHPRRVLAAAAVVLAVSAASASQIDIDTYTLGYLPPDHQVVQDHERIEQGWGPYATLELTLTPSDDERVDSAELLRRTEQFIERATALPAIGNGFGETMVYRRVADVLGGKPYTGELTNALVAQLQLAMSMVKPSWEQDSDRYRDNPFAPFRNELASEGRITLVANMMSAATLSSLIDELHALGTEVYGEHGSLHVTGYPALYVDIIDHVIESQLSSLALALVGVFVLMLIALRSLRLAAISLVPNIIPVVVMLGVMGATGLDLDIATATVAAIVLGISIDDTIHFLWAWRRAAPETLAEGVEHAFFHAGRPAVITSLLLCVGFAVLLLSQVGSVFAFGLLISTAAAAALFADLLVLPVLLSWTLPGRKPDAQPSSQPARPSSPSPGLLGS